MFRLIYLLGLALLLQFPDNTIARDQGWGTLQGLGIANEIISSNFICIRILVVIVMNYSYKILIIAFCKVTNHEDAGRMMLAKGFSKISKVKVLFWLVITKEERIKLRCVSMLLLTKTWSCLPCKTEVNVLVVQTQSSNTRNMEKLLDAQKAKADH